MGELKTPLLTVDVVIRYGDGIVLIERKNYPPGWALPGGFVEVGESVETAAVREAKEETSLDVVLEGLLGIYSDPRRDPRFHTASAVFTGTGTGSLKGRDDAREARIFTEGGLPRNIAFDHGKILSDYFEYVRTGKKPF